MLSVANLFNKTRVFKFNFMSSIGVNGNQNKFMYKIYFDKQNLGYSFLENAVPLMAPTYYFVNANVTFQQTSIKLHAYQAAQIKLRTTHNGHTTLDSW